PAIAHAQRLLRYDPVRETTYRRLMHLYAQAGDNAAALRTYHTCVTVLAQELDVRPADATHNLYVRLLAVDGAP
ncbi:MAG: bacterial transcriptional activator domain-containing protein, partial [Caldilinea sp.]|nr:bacterial transcriptional activator domain-containing protein [Caldilinea sp.]